MRRRQYRRDDNPFDERGLLKDRHVYRASMHLMDSGDRLLSNVLQKTKITDGSTDPYGLHKPGFRHAVTTDTAARDARQRCYDDYQDRLENAWHNPVGLHHDATKRGEDDEITGYGTHPMRPRKPNDPSPIGAKEQTWKGRLGHPFPDDDDDETPRRRKRVRRRRADAAPDEDYDGDQKECPRCGGSGLDDNGDECEACDGTGSVDADYESDPDEIVRNTQTGIEVLRARRTDSRSLAQMMRDHQNKMADIYANLDHELSEKWRQS